jgi:hypothetical protein
MGPFFFYGRMGLQHAKAESRACGVKIEPCMPQRTLLKRKRHEEQNLDDIMILR